MDIYGKWAPEELQHAILGSAQDDADAALDAAFVLCGIVAQLQQRVAELEAEVGLPEGGKGSVARKIPPWPAPRPTSSIQRHP